MKLNKSLKDIFDLLEQTETEILQEIQHFFLRANSLHPGGFNTTDHLQQLIIMLLEYVKEHADLIHSLPWITRKYFIHNTVHTFKYAPWKQGAFCMVSGSPQVTTISACQQVFLFVQTHAIILTRFTNQPRAC